MTNTVFCLYFSRTFPLVNRKWNGFVAGSSFFLYAFEKNFDASDGHFPDGLFNRAEFRNKERTESKAVESENGNVLWNGKSVVFKCADCADCHNVRGGKKRGEVTLVFKKAAGCIVTVLIGKTDSAKIFFLVEINTVLSAGIEAAFVAKASGIGIFSVAADHRNFSVAEFDKRIHRAFCRKTVIGGNA